MINMENEWDWVELIPNFFERIIDRNKRYCKELSDCFTAIRYDELINYFEKFRPGNEDEDDWSEANILLFRYLLPLHKLFSVICNWRECTCYGEDRHEYQVSDELRHNVREKITIEDTFYILCLVPLKDLKICLDEELFQSLANLDFDNYCQLVVSKQLDSSVKDAAMNFLSMFVRTEDIVNSSGFRDIGLLSWPHFDEFSEIDYEALFQVYRLTTEKYFLYSREYYYKLLERQLAYYWKDEGCTLSCIEHRLVDSIINIEKDYTIGRIKDGIDTLFEEDTTDHHLGSDFLLKNVWERPKFIMPGFTEFSGICYENIVDYTFFEDRLKAIDFAKIEQLVPKDLLEQTVSSIEALFVLTLLFEYWSSTPSDLPFSTPISDIAESAFFHDFMQGRKWRDYKKLRQSAYTKETILRIIYNYYRSKTLSVFEIEKNPNYYINQFRFLVEDNESWVDEASPLTRQECHRILEPMYIYVAEELFDQLFGSLKFFLSREVIRISEKLTVLFGKEATVSIKTVEFAARERLKFPLLITNDMIKDLAEIKISDNLTWNIFAIILYLELLLRNDQRKNIVLGILTDKTRVLANELTNRIYNCIYYGLFSCGECFGSDDYESLLEKRKTLYLLEHQDEIGREPDFSGLEIPENLLPSAIQETEEATESSTRPLGTGNERPESSTETIQSNTPEIDDQCSIEILNEATNDNKPKKHFEISPIIENHPKFLSRLLFCLKTENTYGEIKWISDETTIEQFKFALGFLREEPENFKKIIWTASSNKGPSRPMLYRLLYALGYEVTKEQLQILTDCFILYDVRKKEVIPFTRFDFKAIENTRIPDKTTEEIIKKALFDYKKETDCEIPEILERL